MSNSYRDLLAWQQAMNLVELVYKASAGFPKEEVYGLTSQVRRAAVSVAANIAEGQGRKSKGEFMQFLGNAKGSLMEVETHLLIAKRLHFLTEANCDPALEQTARVAKLTNGLLNALKKQGSK